MKRVALALAISIVTVSTAFSGDKIFDYSDSKYQCDPKVITPELEDLVRESPHGVAYGLRLIYIKKDSIVETGRTKDELRCRLTMVSNRGQHSGVFRFHNEEGHALVGWQGNRTE